MLDADLQTQLQGYLEKIIHPIQIVASLDEGDKSRELRELLQEIAALSDKITLLENSEEETRKPSFVIKRPEAQAGIQFAAIPLGHEFTSLVLALLQTGGHPLKLEEPIIEQIRNLDRDCVFETYISLSCHNCPEVVQALNAMALINPRIQSITIDGALFQEEVKARDIMAVPTVFLNGEPFDSGRIGIEQILSRLDNGNNQRQAALLSARQPYDVLIVGGGPAGAAAAIYAARKGIRTGIVAERFGGQVLDTMTIENFISVPETDGPKFAAALEQHVRTYDVDIICAQEATELVPGKLNEIKLKGGATLKGKTVILSTGARWRTIDVPGEAPYRNHGVAYCPHCDGPLFKGKHVAVIGGGNSGVEAAIDLAGIVKHVTLLEFAPALRADAVLQKKLHSLPNVTVHTNAQTLEITGDGKRVKGLSYQDRTTKQINTIELEGVFIQIGLVPNTEWLQGTLALSRYGEIEVDAHGRTATAGVFAAGDVTSVPYKQIVIAIGEGAKAALGAFDYLVRSSVEEDGVAVPDSGATTA